MPNKDKQPQSWEEIGFIPADDKFAWLRDRATGWQYGESGVLLALVEYMKIDNGTAVEIGAGNGDDLPLTCDGLIARGWKADLWEASQDSRIKLIAKYQRAIVHAAFVPGSRVAKYDPAVLVLDVDGSEYPMLRDILAGGFRPRVIICEHMDWDSPVTPRREFVPPPELAGRYIQRPGGGWWCIQATAESIVGLGREYGYEAIGYTRVNTIMVKA